MNYEFNLEILKELDIFSELDSSALRKLCQLFEEKIYNQGEVIFEEGSIENSMMIITSGEVRVSQKADSNTEEALVVLKKGDFFGEMALLDDLPRSATAIAHTNVIIFEISRNHFIDFIDSDAKSGVKVLLQLARILSSRLRETDTKLKTFVNLTKWI
jgi:CRP-like cAMP-binding protein